eukprot:gene17100-20367_t
MSTSRDINAFRATITDDDNIERNYIMVDTEGFGGGYVTAMKGSGSDNVAGKERIQFIKTTYPRLLYLFSNVFVFVFEADPRGKGTIAEYLINYAYTGAARSANQFLRPHLIVIFNKVNGKMDLDISMSTKAFLEDELTKPLGLLFQSINVIYIPENSNFATYVQQVSELERFIKNNLVHSSKRKRDEGLTNTRQFIMKNMEIAIGKFNHSPDVFIDFFDLEACFKPVDRSLSDYIHMYFIVVHNQHESSESTITDVYEMAVKSTIQRIIKFYQDHKQKHGIISPPFLQSLRDSITVASFYIEQYAPCGHIFKGSQCSLRKHMHENTHQSEGLKVEGEFVAHTPPPPSLVDIDFAKDPGECCLQITNDSDKDSYLRRVCIGCIKNVPTQTLACKHVLCADCCNKSPTQCLVCEVKIDRASKDIPESAGYRLLSLCGSGVRGVAECVILNEIQTLVHNINIAKLFDLIVGASTGGLVALALATKNYSPIQCIKLFGMEDDIFVRNSDIGVGKETIIQQPGIGISTFTDARLSLQYTTEEKRRAALGDVFPKDRSIIESSKDVKVAVTSVNKEGGRLSLHLFGSYSRKDHSDYQIDHSSSCLVASDAMFRDAVYPPFKSSNGVMLENNPIVLAMEEGELLWSGQQCDLIASTGAPKYQIQHTKLEATPSLLFNVNLQSTKALDEDLSNLVSEAIRQAKNNEEIKRLSRKLLATLFYIDVEDDDDKLNCTIRYRIDALPGTILQQLRSEQPMFTLYLQGSVIKVQLPPYTINPFGIKLSIDVPPTGDLILDVRCHLQCSDPVGSANDSSISGCPKTIIRKKVNTDY